MFDGADWERRRREEEGADRKAKMIAFAIFLFLTVASFLAGTFMGQALLYLSGRC